jgi:hypothetical protein
MKLLSYADLRERGIRFSRRWLFELVRSGRFPAAVLLSDRSLAWREDEVDQWVENLPRRAVRTVKGRASDEDDCGTASSS